MATKQPSVTMNAPPTEGFSGKTVTVEFLKIKGNEARDIFVGVNGYQALIKRGVPVTIPEEVFEVLQRATYTEEEEDQDDPDKKVWVEKQRHPYNVISRNDATARKAAE